MVVMGDGENGDMLEGTEGQASYMGKHLCMRQVLSIKYMYIYIHRYTYIYIYIYV